LVGSAVVALVILFIAAMGFVGHKLQEAGIPRDVLFIGFAMLVVGLFAGIMHSLLSD